MLPGRSVSNANRFLIDCRLQVESRSTQDRPRVNPKSACVDPESTPRRLLIDPDRPRLDHVGDREPAAPAEHDPEPRDEDAVEHIAEAVMLALDEVLRWE